MNAQPRPKLGLKNRPTTRTFPKGTSRGTSQSSPKGTGNPRARPSKPFYPIAVVDFRREHPDLPLPPVLMFNCRHPDDIKPVTVGAHKDWPRWAKEQGYTNSQAHKLKGLLGCMCRSLAYQRALSKTGSQRHDIAGNPVEPVSDDHRKQVRETLKAHYDQKRKAEARKGNRGTVSEGNRP